MPRKQKTYNYIYKITNIINGQYYVGMHSTDDLEDGYFGSGKRLRRSIKKYGKENFKIEILEFLENRKELVKREKDIVNEDFIKHPLCMNIQIGGEGGFNGKNGFLNKETAIKGRLTVNKILLERFKTDINYRNKCIKNISDGLKKKYKNDPESHPWNDKKHTEATKIKMSQSNTHQVGNNNSQFGTCWITKDDVNKKIKKEELNNYLKTGWMQGRKIK